MLEESAVIPLERSALLDRFVSSKIAIQFQGLIVGAFVCRILALFVEDSLGSPVVEASRAWTRWVMVATLPAAGGTAAESVSRIRHLFLPTRRSRLSVIATPTRSVLMTPVMTALAATVPRFAAALL
jgi:hypothetical protein